MNKIQVVTYFEEEIFESMPLYTITPHDDNSLRIEWEEFYLDDLDLERYLVLTYNKDSNSLFIDFEYNSFRFNIYSFDSFFMQYFTDIQGFIAPLGKKLSPDIEESLKMWENTVFKYYIEESLSDDEYVDVINFLRTKCYIQAPTIVIENTMMESPLLNSLFKNPVDLFPVIYGYPFCTKFFLKFIMPILYDAYNNKKIFQR